MLQAILETVASALILSTIAFVFIKWPKWKKEFKNDLKSVKTEIKDIKDDIGGLKSKYDFIAGILTTLVGKQLEQKASPISLTEYGLKIAERIKSRVIVDLYIKKLESETKNMNAYEIQEHCFEFCRADLIKLLKKDHPDKFEKISSVAFSEGVEKDKILRAVAIEFRDIILSDRGISTQELDGDH